jgi:hypothetical protein
MRRTMGSNSEWRCRVARGSLTCRLATAHPHSIREARQPTGIRSTVPELLAASGAAPHPDGPPSASGAIVIAYWSSSWGEEDSHFPIDRAMRPVRNHNTSTNHRRVDFNQRSPIRRRR